MLNPTTNRINPMIDRFMVETEMSHQSTVYRGLYRLFVAMIATSSYYSSDPHERSIHL